jgi:predicted O-methyltransferase YrrM
VEIEPLDDSRDPFGYNWDLPEGHLTREDERLLVRYARGLCVNLGTFRGRSSVIMSYYADKVITVDCYVEPSFGHSDVIQALSGYPNITPISGRTADMAAGLQDGIIDMLFVDAGHSRQDVVDDYKAYYPKLKSGAVVIFHDYKYMDGHVDDSMDVQGGVREIMDSGTLEHVETGGWCFVGRKK